MARPFKYKTAEALQKKIDEYFDSISYKAPIIIEDYAIDENGNVSEKKIPMTLKDEKGNIMYETKYWDTPTVSGLVYHLEIERQTLLNYEKNDELFDTIKNTRNRLKVFYEKALLEKGHAGIIFASKNFGFTDKVEVEHNVKRIVIQDE